MKILERRPIAVAAAAVFLLALLLRFGFWSEIRGTVLDRWHRMDQTDMATYLRQAEQFANGDWLAREPFHPYHAWQTVAPPEKWLAWYGPHTFHQAPGYSFALALAGRAVGDPLVWFKTLQLVLGAGSAVLAMLLAREVAGAAAGVAAGVLVALYGPLVYLEAQLLREGPGIFLSLAILLGLVHVLKREPETPRRALLPAAALGAAIGVFHLLHEMGTVLFVVAAVALAVHHARRAWAQAGVALGGLCLGYLVGFAPLLARNLIVGAPPLSVSCRTTINFVQANEADAPDGGATFSMPGPNVVRILDQAHGSTLAALAGVWETYHGDVGRLFGNWTQRFGAVWKWPEEADNTSYYFYRDHVRVLRFLPTFALLFPLGCAGALAILCGALARWHATAGRAQPGPPGVFGALWLVNPAGHLVLLLHLACMAGALSLVHTVARFRMYAVPFFWVYAGVALALAALAVRTRRFGALAWLALFAAAGWLAQQAVTRDTPADLVRRVDYAVASYIAVDGGEYDVAREIMDEAQRTTARDPGLYVTLGDELERKHEWKRAADAYRQALALDPRQSRATAGLQRVEQRQRKGP